MTDTNLRDARAAGQRDVSPEFTAKVFAGCGLDRYTTASSALGEMFVAWSDCGVSAVRVAGDEQARSRRGTTSASRAAACRPWRSIRSPSPRAHGCKARTSTCPSICATARRSSSACCARPPKSRRGSARPYRWVARELGAPDATRAVGNALGRNPVPLLIPCHRIIRTDCTTGGYVFGSDAKRTLLEDEGLDFAAIETVTRRGFRYIGCDDGMVLPADVRRRRAADRRPGLHGVAQRRRSARARPRAVQAVPPDRGLSAGTPSR